MYSLYFITLPKVRNKTSYEAPSFHTSGTPRNVPYTILTRDHVYIYRLTNPTISITFNWDIPNQNEDNLL